jgi:hypothetical protein
MGTGIGKLLHSRTTSKLAEQAGTTIPVGGSGLILAYPHSTAGQSRTLGDPRRQESRR